MYFLNYKNNITLQNSNKEVQIITQRLGKLCGGYPTDFYLTDYKKY